jgi:hypothetical protein
MIGFRSKPINELLVALDDASGYGKSKDPKDFWRNKREFMHTK